MRVDVRQTALLLFLKEADPTLHGKVVEVRDVVEKWLSYVPQTFPHYTRHTVAHSDTIILRVSQVLFEDHDPSRPTARLSPMEAYIACATALLHDAGMVVSDEERMRIITSDEWRDWAEADGPGARRWAEIDALRKGAAPPDPTLRNFLADVQLRFLLAEFVRRSHHVRAGDLIRENEGRLADFAFGDPVLLRTISDVCVAHGLDRRELEDQDRFPDRRDVLGQQVNVRFLALLLRLGDLLDMSTDRACPLLLNAACPLPASSLAHWTQYQRLTHFLVSPDRIEMRALCRNQEEHRTIHDWCTWLVDEAANATVLMARSGRHAGWAAPAATMDCADATIRVEPEARAGYIPSNWRFELDNELVFQRLIGDLYVEPLSFVRELIQNALDATRCELYLRLNARGQQVPESPTQVPKDLREQLPVKIRLETRRVPNPLSGEEEDCQILSVEDPGIGMDRGIIERYLLQVGRSYYTTNEFRRTFRFVPMSRFGLGFLSVFAVSDHVSIETWKPTSGENPLRVELTGPRNYILLERGSREGSGTRIEVRLRNALPAQALTNSVTGWCRRVEFPIVVDEMGESTIVRAEMKEQFVYDKPDIMRDGARFVVRAFDIDRRGLEGELYVFTRLDEHGESWDAWDDAYYRYPNIDPRATRPQFPGRLTCIQGLSIGLRQGYKPSSERVDYRGEDAPAPGLSRENARVQQREGQDPRILSRWAEVLAAHLSESERAHGEGGWKYMQSLVDYFPQPEFWASVPETIPLHYPDGPRLASLDQIKGMTRIAVVMPQQTFVAGIPVAQDRKDMAEPRWDGTHPALFADELRLMSGEHRTAIFEARTTTVARWLPTGHLAITWDSQADPHRLGGPHDRPSFLAEFPNDFIVAIEIHSTEDSGISSYAFNSRSPFVKWLISVRRAADDPDSSLPTGSYEKLYERFVESCQYAFKFENLAEYIMRWNDILRLPAELRPPTRTLRRAMFLRAPGNAAGSG